MRDNERNDGPFYRNPSWLKPHRSRSLQKLYYDNADMMQLFNVSSRTLQRWRDEGIISGKKVGGKIYYLAEKVDEMMSGNNDLAD